MLEKIKSLGLTWKFGVIAFVVLLIVVLTVQFILRGSVNKKLDPLFGNPNTKGRFVADLLADKLEPIVKGNVNDLEVQQKLQQIIDTYYTAVYGMYNVRYLLVLDESLVRDEPETPNNASVFVLAHTFDGTVPAWLVETNLLKGKANCTPWKDSKDRLYYDCGVPLKISENGIGAVRVGIYQQNSEDTTWQELKERHVGDVFGGSSLLFTILLTIIVTVLLTGAFWYFVIRRIFFLTEITEKMSFGELEVEVPMGTHDEIGLLEEALERMRANLKEAIERLKERLKRRD